MKLKLFDSLRVVTLAALATLVAWYPIATVFAASARAFDALQRSLVPLKRSMATFGANTLTNLIPDVYSAMDVVSRELVGLLPAVMRDSTAERAAVNQVVRSFVAPASAATDITPGVTPPDDGDQVIGNVSLTITKARRVPFRWNGEQTRGVNNGCPGSRAIQGMQIEQALRTLVNEMEADLAALHIYASRAYGTAATTPFATNLSDPAQLRKILSDNGAPLSNLQLVIDTTAGAAMRTLAQLTKANEANDATMLRQGVLLDMHGFAIRESAQIKQAVTVGTGASATTNTAGYAIGATTVTLASAGTGTFIAGDVVTFAGDTSKYLLVSGDADVSGGGTVILQAPGLRKALAASAVAITMVAAASRSMAFSKNAIAMATRAPALPDDGDMALDRTMLVDPRSGIAFELSLYPQYRQMQYELAACWGQGVMKEEHLVLLLG